MYCLHSHPNASQVSYDASLEEIQKQIEDHLALLLVDQSSVVKRSVLLDIAPLCIFLERQKTNDVLLSHMITYLNDRDWLLRYAFFESIVDVAACLGGRNLEEYIFPLMTQALTGKQTLYTSRFPLALIHKYNIRCRRDECCEGAVFTDYIMRTWAFPEDASLGVDEWYSPIIIPSKCLGQTRYEIFCSSTFASPI